MTLSAGQVLNTRYRVVKLLGQGGFGAVYRAWDVNLERPCALKENMDVSPAAERQFKREARLLADLAHPNLPRVIDHFIIHGQGQYLVMDYVEGEDLQELLRQAGGALEESQVLPWMIQVCDALDYLHHQQPPIIHRDIKPANIRLNTASKAMLVDFGIAKAYSADTLTTVGARAVTPGYSPVEQYGSGATDARSDIYALGATLFTLLSDRVPVESVQRTLRDSQPLVEQVNPKISPALAAVIRKAMQVDPEARFQSAAEMREALRQCQLSTGPSIREEKPTPVVPTVQVAPEAHIAPATFAAQTAQEAVSREQAPERRSPVRMAADSSALSPEKTARLPWFWILGGAGLLAVIALVFLLTNLLGNQRQPTPVADAVNTLAPTQTLESTPTQSLPVEVQKTVPATQAQPTATAMATLAPLETVAAPTIQAQPMLAPGATRIVETDSMIQVYIPEGAFLMGSDRTRDAQARPSELPQRSVFLDAFWIDQTEVTNAMYALCVDAGVCRAPAYNSSSTRGRYFGNPDYAAHPVIYVSWEDAAAYCGWAGRRLPSEAEWEKAARGDDGRLFPWGNEPPTCERANFQGCAQDTVAVGSLLAGASPFGVYDLAGNAWEWVADFFQADYYAIAPTANPTGAQSSSYRALRGGSWHLPAGAIRAAYRDRENPAARNAYFGFRCAASP